MPQCFCNKIIWKPFIQGNGKINVTSLQTPQPLSVQGCSQFSDLIQQQMVTPLLCWNKKTGENFWMLMMKSEWCAKPTWSEGVSSQGLGLHMLPFSLKWRSKKEWTLCRDKLLPVAIIITQPLSAICTAISPIYLPLHNLHTSCPFLLDSKGTSLTCKWFSHLLVSWYLLWTDCSQAVR